MGSTLEYLVRKPSVELEKNPAIFLIHGYGSNEEDLFSFANELPNDHYVFSLRACFEMGYNSYAWYAINFEAEPEHRMDVAQSITSREKIRERVRQLQIEYSLDTNKITLMGFSQGAVLSWALALSYPNEFSRVVAMSGYIEPKTIEETEESHTNIKAYMSHGTSDMVIPIAWARQSQNEYRKRAIDVKYEEFPVGHTVSMENFQSIKEWLTKSI